MNINSIVKERSEPVYSVNGPRLRKWRLAAGVGLRELARGLDVSPAYLSRIERFAVDTQVSDSLAGRITVYIQAAQIESEIKTLEQERTELIDAAHDGDYESGASEVNQGFIAMGFKILELKKQLAILRP